MKRFSEFSEEIKAFGEVVKNLRLERKMTVQELSFEADIDRRTIQRIEKGNVVISLHTLLAIASALKVDPRSFFSFLDKKTE